MAIQTLNTIKQWFKTGLKPTQTQFWDTWDSFRHKFEKVPVKDVDGIDELLLSKADKTVLDNHLADKNAHAPQINTDWNSESGLSQLLNKPEFKTINGEEIIGEGDITISSAIPTLDQVLNSDNKSLTQPIVFLDEEHSSSIDSKNLSINGPLEEVIQYNGDNISWSKGDKNLKLLFDGESAGQNVFSFPEMPDSNTPYKLATNQVVSATQSGIVDNTPLQDLGGVDKLINTVRVGRGNLVSTTNTVFGRNSLGATITGGTNNTAIGSNVMNLATTAPANTGVGSFSLNALTTGSSNVGIGASSLRTITTGSFNMGVGNATLQKIITASHNTAIGAHAGSRITGSKNTAIGFLSQGMSGPDSTGESNITIGLQAGGQLTSGSNNVLIENQETPGSTITSGSNNVILKQGSTSTGVITGNNNTIIGNATGLNSDASNLAILSDGSGNIALRKEADHRLLAPTLTNALIDSGGAKSLVTKEYLDEHSGGGTPTIEQVLAAGDTETTGKVIQFTYPTGSSYLSFSNLNIEDPSNRVKIFKDHVAFYNLDTYTTNLIRNKVGGTGVVNIYEFPEHPEGGTHTFTTTEDLNKQNLQQTLDNGGAATLGDLSSENTISDIVITNEIIVLNNNIVDLDISSGITMGNGTGLKLGYSKPSLGFTTVVEFEEPTKGNSLLFPDKSGTLTTTSDFKTINGQSILGTGDINSSPTLQQVMDSGSAAMISGEAGILATSDNGYSRFYMSGEVVEFNNVDTDLKRGLSMYLKDGQLKINSQNTATGYLTMINVSADPIATTEITFPNKELAGNYVLATTSDFKTINGQSIVGSGDISVSDDNVLHKTGNEFKEGDLNITGNLGITGNIELTDMDTFPRPPETNIILNKNGDLTATNFIGRSITSFTGQFYSNVVIGTTADTGSKLEVNGTISTNGIKIAAALTESSDAVFNSTPVGSQRTIAGNTIQIAGATGDYFLETFRYNTSDYGMQRITFTSTVSAGRFFIRTLTAGVWSAWIEKQ